LGPETVKRIIKQQIEMNTKEDKPLRDWKLTLKPLELGEGCPLTKIIRNHFLDY